MKKLLIVILAFALTGITRAQVLLSENFNNGFPAGWQRINNDGLIPHASVAYVTEAWTVIENPDSTGTGDSVLVATSYYDPSGTADDWLILPAINLQANGNFLEWQVKSQDPSFPDGYQVWMTNTAPVIDSFLNGVQVFYTDFEEPDWTTRTYEIDTFANQTVYIAFRANSNDQFLLLLDDIRVYVDSTAAIDDMDSEIDFSVYPNPADDQLHILQPGNNAFTRYSILDVSGRVLISGKEITAENFIDVSGFVPGIYFIQLSVQQKSAVRKFIVK